MKWKDFMILICFIIAAIVFGTIAWLTLSPTVNWAAPVIAIGLISIGLGVNSMAIAHDVDRKIEVMTGTLNNIERMQEEMHKEQADSHSPIVTSLQALSQHYLDYLAKQQGSNDEELTNDG